MSILGNPVVRSEDPRLLTAGGNYVGDMILEGAAHVAYVRATVAHARLTGIDSSEAAAAPGVLAVITAAELDLVAFLPPEFADSIHPMMLRPWLAAGVVRFCGVIPYCQGSGPRIASCSSQASRYQASGAMRGLIIRFIPAALARSNAL